MVGVPAWLEPDEANAASATSQDKKQNPLAARESPLVFITHKDNDYPLLVSAEITSKTIHLSTVNKTFLKFMSVLILRLSEDHVIC